MEENELHQLAENGIFNNKVIHSQLVETHISWVLLTQEWAFKIKKPLKLSFLDFSSLDSRKKFCERELKLNSRFTDIYISVLPVCFSNNKFYLGGTTGTLVDYAVQMKRMDSSKRMDKMLLRKEVKEENITELAKVIASFHEKAEIINHSFDLKKASETFNDILSVGDFIKETVGEEEYNLVLQSTKWSNAFLEKHQVRFQERINKGFQRDVHGDLHSGNIFLYKEPVLFDCIEFNDAYRQIDVLYELAFLCMDLDIYENEVFSKKLLKEYNVFFNSIENQEDKAIFLYFKILRANIRAKVHALSAMQSVEQKKKNVELVEVKKYIAKMKQYMDSASF